MHERIDEVLTTHDAGRGPQRGVSAVRGRENGERSLMPVRQIQTEAAVELRVLMRKTPSKRRWVQTVTTISTAPPPAAPEISPLIVVSNWRRETHPSAAPRARVTGARTTRRSWTVRTLSSRRSRIA